MLDHADADADADADAGKTTSDASASCSETFLIGFSCAWVTGWKSAL